MKRLTETATRLHPAAAVHSGGHVEARVCGEAARVPLHRAVARREPLGEGCLVLPRAADERRPPAERRARRRHVDFAVAGHNRDAVRRHRQALHPNRTLLDERVGGGRPAGDQMDAAKQPIPATASLDLSPSGVKLVLDQLPSELVQIKFHACVVFTVTPQKKV